MSHSIDLTVKDSYFLKGLAICAVVLLHVLAYLKGIYFASPNQWFFVLIDQLSRFCVPLFLLVSGYGLAVKYFEQKVSLSAYFLKRMEGLIPSYVFWSIFSMGILSSISAWSNGAAPSQWLQQLLLGRADYQLYFVPVLLQMYLLFPLIWRSKKWLTGWLLVAFVSQLLWILWLNNRLPVVPKPSHFQSDSVEYLFALSWIGYFVLGIWLRLVKLPSWIGKVAPPLAAVTLVGIVIATMKAINTGTDPLFALKFTRWPIMVFATTISLTLVWWTPRFRRVVGGFMTSVVEWLGQDSLVIFLSHTIALRLAYAALHQQLNLYTWLMVAGAWTVATYITIKWLQR